MAGDQPNYRVSMCVRVTARDQRTGRMALLFTSSKRAKRWVEPLGPEMGVPEGTLLVRTSSPLTTINQIDQRERKSGVDGTMVLHSSGFGGLRGVDWVAQVVSCLTWAPLSPLVGEPGLDTGDSAVDRPGHADAHGLLRRARRWTGACAEQRELPCSEISTRVFGKCRLSTRVAITERVELDVESSRPYVARRSFR